MKNLFCIFCCNRDLVDAKTHVTPRRLIAYYATLPTWPSSKSKGIKSRITWTPAYHAFWYRSSNLHKLLIASAAICGTMQLPSVANRDFSTADWAGASQDCKGISLALFHWPSPHGSNSQGMFGSIKPWQESPLSKGIEIKFSNDWTKCLRAYYHDENSTAASLTKKKLLMIDGCSEHKQNC